MYKKGDYLVLRSGGVWHVSDMEGDHLYLTLHENHKTKQLSTSSEEIVRPVLSKEAAQDLIGRIPFVRTYQVANERIRVELYEEALLKCDVLEWVKIIKTVYLRQQEKRVSPQEVACGERAKEYLHGELSILLDIPLAEVENYIASAVASDIW